MITEEEIKRFRDNLSCPLPRTKCEWVENDGDLSAWCHKCNSGFRLEAREALRRMYKGYP